MNNFFTKIFAKKVPKSSKSEELAKNMTKAMIIELQESEERIKKLLLYLENITDRIITQTAHTMKNKKPLIKDDFVNWVKEGF
jgi:hypothetical protein